MLINGPLPLPDHFLFTSTRMSQLPKKFTLSLPNNPRPAAPLHVLTAATPTEATRQQAAAPKAPRMLYWEQIDPTSNSLYPLD
jgi:hypothetical protein